MNNLLNMEVAEGIMKIKLGGKPEEVREPREAANSLGSSSVPGAMPGHLSTERLVEWDV